MRKLFGINKFLKNFLKKHLSSSEKEIKNKILALRYKMLTEEGPSQADFRTGHSQLFIRNSLDQLPTNETSLTRLLETLEWVQIVKVLLFSLVIQ